MIDAIAKFLGRILFLPVGLVFTIGNIAGFLDGIDPVSGTIGGGYEIFGFLAAGYLIVATGAGVWMKKTWKRFPPRVRVMTALLMMHGFIFFVASVDLIEKKMGKARNLAEPLDTMQGIFLFTAFVIPFLIGLWILARRFKEEIDPDDPGTEEARALKCAGWVFILCGLYGFVFSWMLVTALFNMGLDNPTFLFLAFMAGLVVLFGLYLVAGFPFGRAVGRPAGAGIIRAGTGGAGIVRAGSGGARIVRAKPEGNQPVEPPSWKFKS